MIFAAVKLRPKDTDAGNSAEYCQIKDQQKLIDNGNPRHLLRADTPYHDIVQKPHKVGDAVLDHDGHGDSQRHPVEGSVAYQLSHYVIFLRIHFSIPLLLFHFFISHMNLVPHAVPRHLPYSAVCFLIFFASSLVKAPFFILQLQLPPRVEGVLIRALEPNSR